MKIEFVKSYDDGATIVLYGAMKDDGKRIELARGSVEQLGRYAVGDEFPESKEAMTSNGKHEAKTGTDIVLRIAGIASVAPNNMTQMSAEFWALLVADRTKLLIAALKEQELL